jgi:cytochrome P450
LKGGMGDDLNAYNDVMGIFFHIKSALYLLITKKIQSIIPLHQKLSNKSDIILELVRKLIETSKDSLKSGNNPNSMLDFMVQSHFDGEMSQAELEGNVFIFFLAGHETYYSKHSNLLGLQNHFPLLFNY